VQLFGNIYYVLEIFSSLEAFRAKTPGKTRRRAKNIL
jgi:hypothetical protein